VTRFIDHLYAHDSWLHLTDHWHTQTKCPQSIIVSTNRFLATDFNTGCVTVSLNYTFQISHIKSFLHSWTFNWTLVQLILFFTASHIELCKDRICPFPVTSQHGPRRNALFPAVTPLLRAYSLQRERVYRAVAQKRSLFAESPLSNFSVRRIIVTDDRLEAVLHFSILWCLLIFQIL
jgi:hypothetical protein